MGLRLQGEDRALTPGGLWRPGRLSELGSFSHPQPAAPVVAHPGDGAVFVLLRASHPYVLVGAAA